jgi:hypothetical protein|eukprot:COSAG06_NODE_2549_length_6687_cov_142.924256_3_plen_134_part_00
MCKKWVLNLCRRLMLCSALRYQVKDPYGMSGFNKRYGSKVKLLEIFDMSRGGEAERHASHDALGGRTLLWHGTNVAVAAAICSSGMRIMPNSGGRVGRGIYLANQVENSTFLRHFVPKMIFLPRQARDKHRKS